MLLHPPIHARDLWPNPAVSKHYNTKMGLAYGWKLSSLKNSLIIHCTNLTGGWQYWCIFFLCWIPDKILTSDFWQILKHYCSRSLGYPCTSFKQFIFVWLALQAGNSEKHRVNSNCCLFNWVAAITFATEGIVASHSKRPCGVCVSCAAWGALIVVHMFCALRPFCTLPPSAL